MIVFNGVEWKIHFVSPFHFQLERPNGTYALGVCDDNLKEIYINQKLKNSFLKKVLAHELAHAAAFSYGYDLTYEEHEMIADFVSTFGKHIIETTDAIFKNQKKK